MKSENKVLKVFGGILKFIGNALWFVFTGFFTGVTYFLSSLFWCITIIGIPFGKQGFKLARLSFFPFGTKVNKNFGKHPVANVIWIIFGGFFISLFFTLSGLFWCITIIGIPFGKQCFKLAGLALMPFGATFGEKSDSKEVRLTDEEIAARQNEAAEKKRLRTERKAEKKRMREEQRDSRLKKRAKVLLVLAYAFFPFNLYVPFGIISYCVSKKSVLCRGLKRYKVAFVLNIVWLVILILMAIAGVVLGIMWPKYEL